MPAKWKGSQGPILVHLETDYDAANEIYFRRATYQGSLAAIEGLELDLQQQGYTYSITNDGPVYTLSTRINLIDPDAQLIDRYEISTESTEIPIWQVPGVNAEAAAFDATRPAGIRTYRVQAEEFASGENGVSTVDPDDFPLFDVVVNQLRAETFTFPVDYIVLRRFRRVERLFSIGATGKINLDAGNRIYTTAELNLPADVSFTLPATPANSAIDFMWGWRKRGQRVEFIDIWVEQAVELLFAQHSLLTNVPAGANLVW